MVKFVVLLCLLGMVRWWGEDGQRADTDAGKPVCDKKEVPSHIEER